MAEEAKIVSSGGETPEPLAPVLVMNRGAAAKSDKPSANDASNKSLNNKDQSDSPYAVSVGDIYEGPLDLLLDLIRKQDIDIYDIPIARITQQDLTSVERLREHD